MNTEDMLDEKDRHFIRRHWKWLSVFGAVIVAGVVAAVLVLTWFVATAQTTGFIPTTLGQWSIGYVINFILHLIFWELLLVVSWVLVILGVLGYRWWKTLSDEEKTRPKRGRREESDAFGFLVTITWLIVVWLDGRWALAFESWTVNDWVYSFLAAVGWDLLIFGIPVLLFFVWWIRKEPKTEPTSIET